MPNKLSLLWNFFVEKMRTDLQGLILSKITGGFTHAEIGSGNILDARKMRERTAGETIQNMYGEPGQIWFRLRLG